mgnify:CR=1 FL=1
MIGVDSPVTVFNLLVSGIASISSALTSPLRTIDTSLPVSKVIAAETSYFHFAGGLILTSEPITQSTDFFYNSVRSLLSAFSWNW